MSLQGTLIDEPGIAERAAKCLLGMVIVHVFPQSISTPAQLPANLAIQIAIPDVGNHMPGHLFLGFQSASTIIANA
jgi:hypothetical protein